MYVSPSELREIELTWYAWAFCHPTQEKRQSSLSHFEKLTIGIRSSRYGGDDGIVVIQLWKKQRTSYGLRAITEIPLRDTLD